jgi:hypothetical protein
MREEAGLSDQERTELERLRAEVASLRLQVQQARWWRCC